jgi:hypothetical protein
MAVKVAVVLTQRLVDTLIGAEREDAALTLQVLALQRGALRTAERGQGCSAICSVVW